ncbi:hypothetical protein Sgou_13160 [Streptomyces gougerotii]|uniref:Uncharacterized protein n=1 Tax=Streptomyces gougerotii TaxID=53448 RepID=A0A8H9LT17_9ACTN|nr:hypothetical protein Sgou_13160 [Streptomyces gougerotii]GGU88280.1 hypothetical protein GCM10010227_48840 [Streptomyces gougerotii]
MDAPAGLNLITEERPRRSECGPAGPLFAGPERGVLQAGSRRLGTGTAGAVGTEARPLMRWPDPVAGEGPETGVFPR